jgi:hypothetical protein
VVFRLIAWFVFALLQRRVALAGDLDRQRATHRLREGYAGGYLTLDEFSRRTGRVLTARSRHDLRRAFSGLPLPNLFESTRLAVREVVLVVCVGAYLVFTLAFGLALALTLLIGGISASTLIVFLLIWLVPTFLLSKLWRRLT